VVGRGRGRGVMGVRLLADAGASGLVVIVVGTGDDTRARTVGRGGAWSGAGRAAMA